MANKTAHPKWRKVGGWFLIFIGIIIILTPFTPGSILLLIGLEMVYGDRVKWIKEWEDKVKTWLGLNKIAEFGKYSFETSRVGDRLYNIELLKPFAQEIPVKEMDVEVFRELVSDRHTYWIDRNDQKLGPYQILKDWEAAQKNPIWADHIQTIKRANLDNPIWSTKDGIVFDGMHRLTRAFIDNVPTIKVKVFETLPEEAIVE